MQNSHAHGDARFNLLGDQAHIRIISNIGADLNAAVHWAGMHDERTGLGKGKLGSIEAVKVEIFAF